LAIVTSRQKTGTHVSVPIPADVAQELLTVLNGNPTYVFWSGNGLEESVTKNWAKYIAQLFDDAKIPKVCYMVSHRLRDTFAVDLLQKGVPMEEVSKLSGHTSIKTTEWHYAKWVKGRQDRLELACLRYLDEVELASTERNHAECWSIVFRAAEKDIFADGAMPAVRILPQVDRALFLPLITSGAKRCRIALLIKIRSLERHGGLDFHFSFQLFYPVL
jgi:hypothetical protein